MDDFLNLIILLLNRIVLLLYSSVLLLDDFLNLIILLLNRSVFLLDNIADKSFLLSKFGLQLLVLFLFCAQLLKNLLKHILSFLFYFFWLELLLLRLIHCLKLLSRLQC